MHVTFYICFEVQRILHGIKSQCTLIYLSSTQNILRFNEIGHLTNLQLTVL